MAGDKLSINKESQKIKKPVIIHFRQPRVIEVDRENFKKVVQKLTGQDDKERSVTKKAVLDPSSSLSIVTADPPTKPAPNEVCSSLSSTLVDSLHGPNNNISWKEVETPGDEPVPQPPCPTPTSDVFQETSYTDNPFDDLLKTTDDFYTDNRLDFLFDDLLKTTDDFYTDNRLDFYTEDFDF